MAFKKQLVSFLQQQIVVVVEIVQSNDAVSLRPIGFHPKRQTRYLESEEGDLEFRRCKPLGFGLLVAFEHNGEGSEDTLAQKKGDLQYVL